MDPQAFWSEIFAMIHKVAEKKFVQYYLQILRCFDYVEEMAPHFRPALDHVKKEPASSIIRFTPLYFILTKVDVYIRRHHDKEKGAKEQDQYSQKLREEFGTISRLVKVVSFWKYSTALEAYLEATQYLKRATLNEEEYFNMNYWLRTNFLHDPKVEEYIVKNDLYRVAYLLYLTGVTPEVISKFAQHCAIGCMALFIGRNRPPQKQLNFNACSGIQNLINLNAKLPIARDTIVPCTQKTESIPTRQIPLDLTIIENMLEENQKREALLAIHMIMRKLFEVSFDYLSLEWFGKQSLAAHDLINKTLKDYCDAFNMISAVSVIEASDEV